MDSGGTTRDQRSDITLNRLPVQRRNARFFRSNIGIWTGIFIRSFFLSSDNNRWMELFSNTRTQTFSLLSICLHYTRRSLFLPRHLLPSRLLRSRLVSSRQTSNIVFHSFALHNDRSQLSSKGKNRFFLPSSLVFSFEPSFKNYLSIEKFDSTSENQNYEFPRATTGRFV